MSLNIDEIYDLFAWDASYSEEEYEARVQQGIAEASHLKNIFPFVQPIIAGSKSSKSVWEPCAKVVAFKSDDELKPYFYLLFEWLQDMNWPGAWIIYNRLAQIPFSKLEPDYKMCRKCAKMTDDEIWEENLEAFQEQCKLKDSKLDP